MTETKQDVLLKRVQIAIAILAGLATLVLGVYNIKKNMFSDNRPGEIRIYAHAENGQSLASVRLDISNSQSNLIASKETDAEGVYKQKDLEVGNYFVKASLRGYEPQVLSFYVASKKETALDIALRALPSEAKPTASPVRSAIEEVGASWIKTLGKPKAEEAGQK